MNASKQKLIALFLALAGALFLIPMVKRLVTGEPLDGVAITFFCLAIAFFILALAASRKASRGPSTPQ